MSEILDRVLDEAARQGRPPDEAVRHHLLESLLRRVGRLADADAFVLRGGMLTRLWVRPVPRPTTDLDFLGTSPADAEETARRFFPALGADAGDDVRFDPSASRVRPIWQETDFPGVRLQVRAAMEGDIGDLQIDVGFGDPLTAPPRLVDYPTLAGLPARVWCCRPETMAAWKLHGLAEMGERRWRPKDLHDLFLICERVRLEDADLRPAIAVAFTSRGFPAEGARAVLSAAWWDAKMARARWDEFRQGIEGPAASLELAEMAARVRTRLAPVLP